MCSKVKRWGMVTHAARFAAAMLTSGTELRPAMFHPASCASERSLHVRGAVVDFPLLQFEVWVESHSSRSPSRGSIAPELGHPVSDPPCTHAGRTTHRVAAVRTCFESRHCKSSRKTLQLTSAPKRPVHSPHRQIRGDVGDPVQSVRQKGNVADCVWPPTRAPCAKMRREVGGCHL